MILHFVIRHFNELKLFKSYIDTMINESLFLLYKKLWVTSFSLNCFEKINKFMFDIFKLNL